jgi:uncharacterized protein YcbX
MNTMAILSELILYPIKSCAGISVRAATLTRAGLALDGLHDREWMVVGEDGRFLTQREHPRMALIAPHLETGSLQLHAPGLAPLGIALGLPDPQTARTLDVRVWDDSVPAYDCGQPAATWFSQAIGVPCRLVRFHPHARRLASVKWTGGVEAPTRFADGYPLLVIGSASLADLNRRLAAAGRAPLPMNRFRPNLVIDGIDPFEEDYAARFQLGEAVLTPVKPCPRCPIPAVDQATGLPGPDPLDILQAYRARPQMDGAVCFGMNCIVTDGDGQRLFIRQEVMPTLAF